MQDPPLTLLNCADPDSEMLTPLVYDTITILIVGELPPNAVRFTRVKLPLLVFRICCRSFC